MHLFAKQINRHVTQANISHRAACVNRPVPEGKGKGEKDRGSLFTPSATTSNNHTAETCNSQQKIKHRPSPPLSHPPPPNPHHPQHHHHTHKQWQHKPGSLASYEHLLDAMVPSISSVYILDSGAVSPRETILAPSIQTSLTTFMRIGEICALALLG